MTFRQIVAENVRIRRKAKNWDQGRLAEKANVSQAAISQIESCSRDPSMDTFYKIARALEVHPSKLFEKIDV